MSVSSSGPHLPLDASEAAAAASSGPVRVGELHAVPGIVDVPAERAVRVAREERARSATAPAAPTRCTVAETLPTWRTTAFGDHRLGPEDVDGRGGVAPQGRQGGRRDLVCGPLKRTGSPERAAQAAAGIAYPASLGADQQDVLRARCLISRWRSWSIELRDLGRRVAVQLAATSDPEGTEAPPAE